MHIFVDLDKTFIKEDINLVLFKHVLKTDYFFAAKVAWNYFFYGPIKAKKMLTPYIEFVNLDLLVNKKLLEFLELQKTQSIFLATSSHFRIAKKIIEKWTLFKDYIASDENYNCIGDNKLKKIEEMIGKEPFFYIGDSIHDLVIWQEAAKIGIVHPNEFLLKEVQKMNKEYVIFV